MSPTLFRHKSYRFFFFSKEENRPHVHVSSPDGEAKFWVDPVVALADHEGLTSRQLSEMQRIIEGRKMKSAPPGTATLKAEVLNISHHGVWLLALGREYFLTYAKFPWFKKAVIGDVMNVRLIGKHHLRWSALDIDIDIASLDHPDQYPLTYKK